MFFDILSISRGSIILTNQLSVLIALFLASRLDFFIFGLGFVLVLFLIQYRVTPRDKNRFISLLLTLRLSVAIICLLIILFLIQINLLNFPIIFWIFIIPSILMGGVYPLWFFQVNKIPQTMILPTFMSRLVYLLVIYLLVNDNSSAYWAFLAARNKHGGNYFVCILAYDFATFLFLDKF